MYDGPLLLGSGSGDGDTSFLTGLTGRLDPHLARLVPEAGIRLAHCYHLEKACSYSTVQYWQFKLFPWINSVSSSSSSETCASTTLRPSLAGILNTFQHHRP